MIPSLEALLQAACRLHGLTDADIRIGLDARCRAALGAYVYMAAEATEQDAATIALYAGRSISLCQEALTQVETTIAGDARYADLITEAMIEAMALDGVAARRMRRVSDMTAGDIAHRLLGGRADAITLGGRHYRQIAAAYLAQADEIVARDSEIARLRAAAVTADAVARGTHGAVLSVARAWRDYERDRYSPGVRLARERLEATVAALADIHAPLPKPAPKKEAARV